MQQATIFNRLPFYEDVPLRLYFLTAEQYPLLDDDIIEKIVNFYTFILVMPQRFTANIKSLFANKKIYLQIAHFYLRSHSYIIPSGKIEDAEDTEKVVSEGEYSILLIFIFIRLLFM